MSATMTRDDVACGVCHALVHAVQLLEDSAVLYSLGRAATSLHLCVMAREELGRFRLLANRHAEMTDAETIDTRQLAASLADHKVKLSAGQSVTPVPMTLQRFEEWLRAIEKSDDVAVQHISEEIHKRAATLKPHQVAELHERRLKAQYVDIDRSTGKWSKPSDTSLTDADSLIRMVMAEIANALISIQGRPWIICAFQRCGENRPHMGEFTHRVFAHLQHAVGSNTQ